MERINLIKVQYIDVWNTIVKPLWMMNIHLKNEKQEYKTGPDKEWILMGGGEWMERVSRVNIVHVLYMLVFEYGGAG
jgi:hypothetical protein